WHQIPRPATSLRNIALSLVNQSQSGESSSYLVFDSSRVVGCLYSVGLRNCERCVDCYLLDSCSHCYECINCVDCKDLYWSEHSILCEKSYFLSNCKNCSDCIYCTNLSDSKFCIFNE